MKELIEKKNDLITRADEMLNNAKMNKRELTEAEAAELAEIRDNVRRIVETLKLDEDFKEIELKEKEDVEPKEEKKEVTVEEQKRAVENTERKAFENYLRGVKVHERAGELSPTVWTSGAAAGAGGALIPTSVANEIIRKVYDISPILERSQRYNIKGNLAIPFYPADANDINVAYQQEFSPLASSSGSFSTIDLTGFLAGCLTKISRTLINNVQFDIVGFVVNEMAEAIKRFIEKEMLIGTNGKVTGLSTLTNGVTAASATAITADEIIELHDKVKDAYQNNAIWVMSSATRTALRQLKSSATGIYLLNDDMTAPFGTALLGKPVYVSDNMPNIATGRTVIYYGDMRGIATKFAEDINVEVLRERYADEHAVGVVGWFEFDAKVRNEQMLAKLTMA